MQISRYVAILVALLAPSFVYSQSETPSLGDVARQTRAAKQTDSTAQPKQVLENEDLGKYKGPIPEIAVKGNSNVKEITEAILAYASKHSDQDIETTIR